MYYSSSKIQDESMPIPKPNRDGRRGWPTCPSTVSGPAPLTDRSERARESERLGLVKPPRNGCRASHITREAHRRVVALIGAPFRLQHGRLHEALWSRSSTDCHLDFLARLDDLSLAALGMLLEKRKQTVALDLAGEWRLRRLRVKMYISQLLEFPIALLMG